MRALLPEDLMGLEEYAHRREEFRAHVMAHKRHRRLDLGEHLGLCFESRLTVQYRVQETLREKGIVGEADIRTRLAAHDALVPEGGDWRATLRIDPPDAVGRLLGVEHRVWAQIGDQPAIAAVVDEDPGRSTDVVPSAVHVLRFPLTPDMVGALKAGADLAVGVDHPACRLRVDAVPELLRESLLADLD